MRRHVISILLIACGAAGCQEPPRYGEMSSLISDLANMRVWDPTMQGKGYYAYDRVMGFGPDIYPVMVSHLINETPTAIYDEASHRNPCIADVVFLMLLELTNHKWQDFAADGVFVSSALSNPIFCIKWDRATKFKVKARFAELLEVAKGAGG
jgi:hypothetical protein